MACYRLTFENGKVFEVLIEAGTIAGEVQAVHAATIYRVTNDVRDYQPILRSDGGPIQVAAASEHAARDIAASLLSEAVGSKLDRVGECGNQSRLPPLPH